MELANGVRAGAESAAIRIRCDAYSSLERASQRLGGAEAASLGDRVERRCRRFQFVARGFDADSLDVARRCLADLLGEHATEVPAAHRGARRQEVESVVVGGMGVDVVLRGTNRRSIGDQAD